MEMTAHDTRILSAIAEDEAHLIGRAVEWCAINSGSHNREGLEAVLDALEDTARALPGTVTRRPLPDSELVGDDGKIKTRAYADALLIEVRPEAPVQVIMTGHYDTVFPANSAFQTVKTRADGALWGPGIADMKGGISVMLGALEAFEAHPLRDRVGYRVLLSPDEEIGSPGSAPVLAEIAKLGHVGLTYEPALSDGSLASARKGSGNYSLIVHGKSAHAGRAMHEGRNAVVAAAMLCQELNALNGQRDGVTLNIGAISGGSAVNVVPDNAVIRFNVRVPDESSAAWIAREVLRISQIVPFEGIHTHLHGGFTRPPKPFDPAQQELFAAVKDAGELLGQSIRWAPSGGVCEGNNLYAAGLPNVDTLGVIGGDIHSDAEYARPDSFVARTQLSALLLMKLASGDIDAHRLKMLREQLDRDGSCPPA